jgi:hypothetical protein
MSKEQVETSREDKFFGVKHTIGEKDEADAEPIEIETEEESGEVKAEKVPESKKEPAKKPEGASEEQMEKYSDKVQKRIDTLVWQAKEAERQAEAARKENVEAVRYAQGVLQQNRKYEQVISHGEARLVEQIKSRATLAVQQANAKYKAAYESGDTDAIIAAQNELITANAEARSAQDYDADYQQRAAQWAYQQQQRQLYLQNQQRQYLAQQQQQQPQAQQPQIPKPSEEALNWTRENPWFQNPKHKDMTALAYGIHERLIRDDGVEVNSDRYYQILNNEMRDRFPDYFEAAGTGQQSASRPNTVVASGSRNTGAKSRKVKLSPSQVALAKKFGLTLEQYAAKLPKE